VTAQALNDPSILDKGFDLLLGKEKFPVDGRVFHDLGEFAQMAEPLFQSVSSAARATPDRYFALSAIASPEMQRRYEAAGVGSSRTRARRRRDRRGGPLRRALAAPPLPGRGAAQPVALARGTIASTTPSASSRRRDPGARRAAGDQCRGSSPAATAIASGSSKIVSPDILHKTEMARHAQCAGIGGGRRLRPTRRAGQGAGPPGKDRWRPLVDRWSRAGSR